MTEVLVAESAVRQLYSRYTDAVWRNDCQAVGYCYTEDAEWRIEGSIWRGQEVIATHLDKALALFDGCLITLYTPILDVQNGERSGNHPE